MFAKRIFGKSEKLFWWFLNNQCEYDTESYEIDVLVARGKQSRIKCKPIR
jgi:hypothetical protein